MLVRVFTGLLAAVVLAPAAFADGGPDPGVLQGGAGIAGTHSPVRFVTVQAGQLTTLEKIATNGGQILNSALIHGGWGIPLVDFTGSVGDSRAMAERSCSAPPALAAAIRTAAARCARRPASR